MPRTRRSPLSLAEWLVLCLVDQEPAHGFAIATLLAEHGELGRIWHVPKAVVYRAAQRLEQLGLITAADKEPSSLGPARAQLQATPQGSQAAREWLRQPAAHPRDIRAELLVKLALHDRAGADPRDLLRAQRDQLTPIAHALDGQLLTATGLEHTLTRWRHESITASLRFLDALLQSPDRHDTAQGGTPVNGKSTQVKPH